MSNGIVRIATKHVFPNNPPGFNEPERKAMDALQCKLQPMWQLSQCRGRRNVMERARKSESIEKPPQNSEGKYAYLSCQKHAARVFAGIVAWVVLLIVSEDLVGVPNYAP